MIDKLHRRSRAWMRSSLLGLYALHSYHWIRAITLSRLSDEHFAQRLYHRAHGKTLDLADPVTFDERQWWLKLHYRDPLMTRCTDKLAVRKYVEEMGLGHLLLPLLGSWAQAGDIDWGALPSAFYLKTNNSSATNLRCDDLATFDKSRAVRLLGLYLRRNHYVLSREWNYRGIEPRVLAEPVIESGEGGLVDYRYLCSYGVCHGIFVDVDTASETGGHRADAKRNVYDREWNLLDVRVTRPRIEDRVVERPAELEDMIRYAEALSKPFPFCRVDFYNPSPGRVVFGEITFFHAGGSNRITPEAEQEVLGGWIDLDRVREKRSSR